MTQDKLSLSIASEAVPDPLNRPAQPDCSIFSSSSPEILTFGARSLAAKTQTQNSTAIPALLFNQNEQMQARHAPDQEVIAYTFLVMNFRMLKPSFNTNIS